MLAMDRIRVVAAQSTVRADMADLGRAEDRLRQSDEQRDPEDHDQDGEQPPGAADERNVAESGRGEGRDREVQRINIVPDAGIDINLRDVNQRGYDKDEDQKIDDTLHHFFVACEEGHSGLAVP